MKILLSLLLFLFTVTSLYAQRYYPSGMQSRARISAGTGSSTYYGDLQEESTLSRRMNFSLSYEYQLKGRLGLRADGTVFQLGASDATSLSPDRQVRNLSFHATNAELSGSMVLYLFRNLPAAYRNRSPINLYALIGAGLTYYNPKTTYQGNTYHLRDFKTEGVAYGRFTPVIPMGLGIQAKAGRRLDIAVEAVYRATFTDYLDDVSSAYLGQEQHTSETAALLSDRRIELGHDPAKAGAARGNPDLNDGYAFYNVRFIYYLHSPYYKAADKNKKLIR